MSKAVPVSASQPSKAWNVALWVVQVLLAAAFGMAGVMKTTAPIAGLVLVMALAAAFHVSRGEFQVLPINFALGALAAFVAWGRTRKAPIAPR